jgi:RNA 3'-terminal phosphate cyclase
MTDPADTLAQVRAASLDTISKAAKAEFLRERGWRPEGGGKTKKWRSPGGILASSASVACRLQVLADEAEA